MRNSDERWGPRHPAPRLHAQQGQALQQLPEPERAAQAQLLRIGNAAHRYHQLADDDQLTEDDVASWLAGLPPRRRLALVRVGFAAAGSSWAFRWNAATAGRRPFGSNRSVPRLGPAGSNKTPNYLTSFYPPLLPADRDGAGN